VTEPCFLSARDAAAAIRAGALTSEALVSSCLRRIAVREDAVHAWAWLDPDAALAQARACDASAPRGPLHGVPIGVKDVIDTADMPTELGAAAFAGRRPTADAAGIALLRAAGVVIMGKTVTAELATYHPGPTANPRRTSHTPGGSSSGSAAAVADFHVPLALGTQTVGSIVRPASYCGILGFKPSFDRYPIAGVLETAIHLDTLGSFARTTEDLLLLDAILSGDGATPAPAATPVVGLYRSGLWGEASPAVHAAFAATAAALSRSGARVVEAALPPGIDALQDKLLQLHLREVATCLGHICREQPDGVSDAFKLMVAKGEAVTEADYQSALHAQQDCKLALADALLGMDLVLTPSARDIAPEGLGATGDPLFCRGWTGLGVPSLGFPATWQDELSIGLQFVGRTGEDRAMLATAGGLLDAIGVTAPIVEPHNLHLTESL
jgi:Asp-tRNA(Asn)/Glu-tRNA(Gln) amidotransferase A subunit family amidase